MNDITSATMRAFEDAPDGRIPGGCEYCDAYQTAAQYAENVILIGIHHDDWCRFYLSLP